MSVYPVLSAGQRITAALLTSMLPITVIKPGDTTRTSTTTVADDPDLTLALEANATYLVEFFIIMGAETDEDFKSDWNVTGSTTPTGFKGVLGPGSTVADSNADNIAMRAGVHGFGTDITYSGTRSATLNNQFCSVREWGYVITTTTANIAYRWAQGTSGTTGTILAAGSTLLARRIA